MKGYITALCLAVLVAVSISGHGGCGKSGGGGDSTPPTVLSVSPVDGAAGVPVTTTITATFSEAMGPASINTSTFTLGGATGTVSYDGATATLTPSADLAYSTTYTATVTTGAKDAAGNSIAAAYAWSFTTRPPPGALDATFGISGTVTTALGSGDDWILALGLQDDGKIVVAGYAYNGTNNDFALARYNSNGTLDPTFGSAGTVTTALGSSIDIIYALGIQTDGKIVVVGYTYVGATCDFALARYNSNGTLDPTFGSAGTVTTALGSGNDVPADLRIQADGKIVVAGYTSNGANNDFALARYTATGTLDSTFGSAGTVTTALGSSTDIISALKIQSDGKIVVAGQTYNGLNYDFALARYNSNGTLDPTFGSAGTVTTALGSGYDEAAALGLQPDGKIVVAGRTSNGANTVFVLARYTTAGALDPTFGSAGTVTTAIGNGDDYLRDLAIQADGRIVLAGYAFSGATCDFALARYNSNGTLDPSFGSAGTVTTTLSSGNDLISAIALQTDGKIVTAGYASNGANLDFALARYWP